MDNYTIIFIETGLGLNISDLNKISSSTFPFWGEFTFLDFFLTHFYMPDFIKPDRFRRILVLESCYREIYSIVNSRWNDETRKKVSIINNMNEIIELLETDSGDTIILTSLRYIALFDVSDLFKLAQKPGKHIIKVSIDSVPLDLYIIKRNRLIKILKSSHLIHTWKNSFSNFLFNEILHTCFDIIKNIPGMVLFNNNLMQLYKKNLWLLEHIGNSELEKALKKLITVDLDKNASHIAKKGYVKNSHIARGVEIKGFVENSIIFHGVTVHKKAKIINSVIMNNNRIGENTVIKNALILPFTKEVMKGAPNIEENVYIGGDSTQIKNIDFPDQIYDGITVIGMNPNIPKGVRIEQGCYVGENASPNIFKSTGKLQKGKSLVKNEEK